MTWTRNMRERARKGGGMEGGERRDGIKERERMEAMSGGGA